MDLTMEALHASINESSTFLSGLLSESLMVQLGKAEATLFNLTAAGECGRFVAGWLGGWRVAGCAGNAWVGW